MSTHRLNGLGGLIPGFGLVTQVHEAAGTVAWCGSRGLSGRWLFCSRSVRSTAPWQAPPQINCAKGSIGSSRFSRTRSWRASSGPTSAGPRSARSPTRSSTSPKPRSGPSGQHWASANARRARGVSRPLHRTGSPHLRLQGGPAFNSEMTFRGETVNGDHAVVRTTLLLSKGGDMSLDYLMHLVEGRWQVYDLNIEGISLVANYRSQFNKIIRTSSYEALVTTLRSRQVEFQRPLLPLPEQSRCGDVPARHPALSSRSLTGKLLQRLVRLCCARPAVTVSLGVALAALGVGYAAHSLTLETSKFHLLPLHQRYASLYKDSCRGLRPARGHRRGRAKPSRRNLHGLRGSPGRRPARRRASGQRASAIGSTPATSRSAALLYLPLDTLRDTLDTVASQEELLADFAATQRSTGSSTASTSTSARCFLPAALGPGAAESRTRARPPPCAIS